MREKLTQELNGPIAYSVMIRDVAGANRVRPLPTVIPPPTVS